jgi:hypothetical protein
MLHPDSSCFLIFQVNTREENNTERVETYPLKNPSSWRRRGKQKEAQV